ncbi:succinyl-CoA ligase [ADP-forming] subunit alpha [bacterium BMS3Abin14]|nr:succinyl-CoA ligase [ADP-forming] subunit alpha [bacterium BMS3Abin14]
MKSVVVNMVRTGFFLDSVALMRLSRTISELEGVEESALMIGTPSNKEIMKEAGILGAEGENASGRDLIIGIRAVSREAADKALEGSVNLLANSKVIRGKGATLRPRTIASAVKSAPDVNLALISVAGEFAGAEARKALHKGLHVMIFSDNVPLSEEIQLKREARELDRLMMGPDCGTTIISGAALAFGNKVNHGDIGIIGASGTGIQEISCLISRSGGGISQAIGVGGRDLKEEVGGISTMMALEALEEDSKTRHIVLVSKSPGPSVAERIMEKIKASSKNFTICYLGLSELELPDNAVRAPTLKAAAQSALGGKSIFDDFDVSRSAVGLSNGRNEVIGLFSGGTLCAEAQLIFLDAGEALSSNAPVPGVSQIEEVERGHHFIDLGEDAYTLGRPHPMIDPAVRDDGIQRAMDNPKVGVVLVDIVIGYGAHQDPAGHLVSTLGNYNNDGPLVITSVTGTDADIQNRSSQVKCLENAGVLVAPSNVDAALLALACIKKGR